MKHQWKKSNILPEVGTFTNEGVEGIEVIGKTKSGKEMKCWVTFYPVIIGVDKIQVKHRWDSWDDVTSIDVVEWRYKTKEDE